jgi:amino acid permease
VVLWNAALKRRFSGIELVAVCAGEAENARKTVPRAIKRVFWRLLCFYVLGIFVIR